MLTPSSASRDPLRRVLESDLCAGCGMCTAIIKEKLQLHVDDDGFLRPSAGALSATSSRTVFEDVCPGLGLTSMPRSAEQATWGPVRQCLTGHSSRELERWTGSSGGVLTSLVSHMLESGRAKSVLHVGPSDAEPTRSAPVVSRTPEEVLSRAGSRYGPVSALTRLRACLDEGEPFVLVGKPCEIAAVRRYARHDSRVDRLMVAALSFFCAGTPSNHGTDRLVQEMGVDDSRVRSFRYRGEGWPGPTKAVLDDGSTRTLTYETAWGTILNQSLQFRCKVCIDGVGDFADIACADAWKSDDRGYPLYPDDDPGRSVILARTPLGEQLLDSAVRAGRIEVEPLNIEELREMHPYHVKRRHEVPARVVGLAAAGRVTPRYRGFRKVRLARRVGLRASIRAAVGSYRRGRRGGPRKCP